MNRTLRRILLPLLVALGLTAGHAFHPARAATPAPRTVATAADPVCISGLPYVSAICIPR
jgi:hypothetical protein